MARKLKQQIEKDTLLPRSPVVVVLGHVDHGKTSLLQSIRDIQFTGGKPGGFITQHIGAYQVEKDGKKTTFIDTPGHEAFSAMRARGAKVADIAILVVAADDGVKPQTKEAISHIKLAAISMIIAINKIDKPEVQPEKIKSQLAKEGVLVESMGGDTPSVNLSAKTGQGIEELLDIVSLVAEMQDLRFDPTKPAEGLVIEARLDPLRGPTATLLVRDGTLKKGGIIGTSTTFGRIKVLEDFQAKVIDEAPASQPVVAVGFEEVPEVGDKFFAFNTVEEAKRRIEIKQRKIGTQREVLEIAPGTKIINLIIKADVRGSLEPIRECLRAIPQDEILLRVLSEGVGEINDSDVRLAEIARAIILGFRVNSNTQAQNQAEQRKVKVMVFEVIYDFVQAVRGLATALLEPEILRQDLGRVKILAIFRQEKNRMIVGGKVIKGEVKKGALIDVIRGEEKIGRGKLAQLQRDKKDADMVISGQECGILFDGEPVIAEGDVLEIYEQERKKREI